MSPRFSKQIIACLALGLAAFAPSARADGPALRVHYLGHAAFVLRFDNGVTVLTDHGTSRAWGLDSPIHGTGDLKIDVATCSHRHHEDHYAADRVPAGARFLTGTDGLVVKGLEIRPIPTCEKSVGAEDVTSYLFVYKGLRILHLGDPQAYIIHLEQEGMKRKVRGIYPPGVDLLLMTIGYIDDILVPAEAFLRFLNPKRAIPMHYWSPRSKADFLVLLRRRNQQGERYRIVEAGGPEYALFPSAGSGLLMEVISLEPEPFGGK